MRFRFGLPLVLAVMGTNPVSAQLYSNVLVNPGFEAGASASNATGWILFNNAFRYAYAGAHGGAYALDAYGNWWPTNGVDWNASGAYQDKPAAEGQIWEASVWVQVTDPIQGQAFATLNMDFLDAASNDIFQAIAAKHITSSTPTGQWTQIKVKCRCNRSTAFVRITPLFLQSPAHESGAVWFDDCALYQTASNFISFAGRNWFVWDGYSTPGVNYFSTNCVYLDTNGWLHLESKLVDGVRCAAALETTNSQGFGEYRWQTETLFDRIDSNLVVGMFTYASEPNYGTNQNEVDIEFTHAFPGSDTNAAFYTVQPYNINGNGSQNQLIMTNAVATHRFTWQPDEIHWQSFYGHTPEPPTTNFVLAEWRFRGRGIPIETNEHTVMNLWLFYTNSLRDTQLVEYVVRDFTFTPFDGFLFEDTFDDNVRSDAWAAVGAGVQETNFELVVSPSWPSPSGYSTTNAIHRNERGTRYVFSSTLSSAAVSQARGGEDVRSLMTLSESPGSNAAWDAHCAVTLQGRYDADSNSLTLAFFTKTNAPGSDGTLRFQGVLTNFSAAGAVDLRFELEPSNYFVKAVDAGGHPLPLSTNQGASTGTHDLREKLTNGYWFVGAENSDPASSGTIYYDRVSVGVGDQKEAPRVVAPAIAGTNLTLSFPGFFDTPYTIARATNAMGPYVPVATNVSALSSNAFTVPVGNGPAAYYRVEM